MQDDSEERITLVSSDLVEFEVSKAEARCSGMIRRLLDNPTFIENQQGRISLPTIPSDLLKIAVEVRLIRSMLDGG